MNMPQQRNEQPAAPVTSPAVPTASPAVPGTNSAAPGAPPAFAAAAPAPPPYVPRKQTEAFRVMQSTAQSQKGLAAVLCAVLLSFLFVETVFFGELAVTVPVLFALYTGFVLWFFHEPGHALSRAGLWLTLPAGVIAVSFALYHTPSTAFLRLLVLLCLLCMQLVLLSDSGAAAVFSFDLLLRAGRALLARPLSNLDLGFRSLGAVKKAKGEHASRALKAAGGLLLALPVAFLLLYLFMRADAVFESGMDRLMRSLNLNVSRLISDFVLTVLLAVYAAALLIAAKANTPPAAKKEGKRFLDPVAASAFLGVIDVAMLSFVAVQFAYLFFGASNALPDGLTYAQYARRGFFELAFASALCFGIAALIMAFCRLPGKHLPLAVRVLLLVMCAANGVVLASAAKRMLLYVSVYGLSVRRALTMWLMAVIAVSLLWLALRCLFAALPAPALIGVTVIAGVCALSLCNLDRTVARYNVDRFLLDPVRSEIDVSYFYELSYAALPELARLQEQLDAGILSPQNDDTPELAEQKAAKILELRRAVGPVMQTLDGALRHRHYLYGYTLDTPALNASLNRR